MAPPQYQVPPVARQSLLPQTCVNQNSTAGLRPGFFRTEYLQIPLLPVSVLPVAPTSRPPKRPLSPSTAISLAEKASSFIPRYKKTCAGRWADRMYAVQFTPAGLSVSTYWLPVLRPAYRNHPARDRSHPPRRAPSRRLCGRPTRPIARDRDCWDSPWCCHATR